MHVSCHSLSNCTCTGSHLALYVLCKKWCLNLNTDTFYILSLTFMSPDKEFSHECEAKDVFINNLNLAAIFLCKGSMAL